MVYVIPIQYKCPKCGFEMAYTVSEFYEFLPVSQDGHPFCHKCLIEFLTGKVPVMERKEEKSDG